MRLKIGDKVKLVNTHYGDSHSNPVWDGFSGKMWGRIKDFTNHPKLNIRVKWGNGYMNSYKESDLEKGKNSNIVFIKTGG